MYPLPYPTGGPKAGARKRPKERKPAPANHGREVRGGDGADLGRARGGEAQPSKSRQRRLRERPDHRGNGTDPVPLGMHPRTEPGAGEGAALSAAPSPALGGENGAPPSGVRNEKGGGTAGGDGLGPPGPPEAREGGGLSEATAKAAPRDGHRF